MIEKSLGETLNAVNQTLETHEKVDRIVIANNEWTIENDLLTPTMKIKRELLETKYQQLIGDDIASSVQWEHQK